jgi:phenylalanyl-tRNA synthetase alpha chain
VGKFPRILVRKPNLNLRGAWKTSTFKKYNFEAEGIPTSGGALHPLLKVREEIRNIFLEMG